MTFDETFDFVVVGSGGGSMCAGLVMREAGRSVVVLEKTEYLGGTTARSGGVMWVPNNPFMARDGVQDSLEQASLYLEGLAGGFDDTPGSTPERRRAYLTQAPKMVGFLLRQGIKLTRAKHWPDYYDDMPGGSAPGRTVVAEIFDINELGPWAAKLRPGFVSYAASLEEMMRMPTYKRSWSGKLLVAKVLTRGFFARLAKKRYISAGAALQGRMLQQALKAGVDLRTDTPVSALLEEGGRMVGVVTTRDGKPWRIGARLGVLVNAGGFAHNQDMRDQHLPGTRVEWTSAAPGDTGEMIQEMSRHGAALAQMDERVGNQTTLPPGADKAPIKPSGQSVTAAPHAILVDQTGVRYMNEGGSYMAYCKAMLKRNETVPAVPSYAILDAQYMKKYMLAGTMPGSKKPQAWRDSGYLKHADTVEALAGELSIDPKVLRTTVDRWNGFVGQGKDEDFGRGGRAYDNWLGDRLHPTPTLGDIAKAPFYAVPILPGDVGTYGGVVTDSSARVLREDGSVIEGLYATGVSTASVMGRSYPGAGSSVGPSFTWGYVAARHAAGVNTPD